MFCITIVSFFRTASTRTATRPIARWCAATRSRRRRRACRHNCPAHAATRSITGDAPFVINDYEKLGSDERCNRDVNINFTLTSRTDPLEGCHGPMRWRDPRRASLHGPRRERYRLPTKGRVDFFGEGDSENDQRRGRYRPAQP